MLSLNKHVNMTSITVCFCFSAKQGTKRFYEDVVVEGDTSAPLTEHKREDQTLKASKEEKPDKGTAQFTFRSV